MKKFINSSWQDVLRFNRIDRFETLWHLDIEQVDKPNCKGRGWSEVGKIRLDLPDGNTAAVFIKRQENYTLRSLVFPVIKVMSFEREIKCFLKFIKHGIPVPEPIYFEKKRVGRDKRAVLIIKNLDGYENLTQYIKRMQQKGISCETKKRVISSLATVIKRLHDGGYLHGALFGKHIFVKENEDGSDVDVRLIDLEFVRWHPNRMHKDLSRLYIRLPGLRIHDAVRFLINYMREKGMTPRVRRTAKKIEQRLEKKSRRRELKKKKDRN